MSDYVNYAQEALSKEIEGLKALHGNLPADFDNVAEAIFKCKGRLIVSGIGKSGYIGQKISSSLASTGTRSFYIHPAEASHGDLGMIGEEDIVLLLSNSGETKELLDIISYCKRFSIIIIGMTMQIDSILAKNSTYLLNIPFAEEASCIDAPTTSSTMMLVLGDALVVALHKHRGFSKDDYAVFHPGGKIGAGLLKVEELMHAGLQVPFVKENASVHSAIVEMSSKGFGCTAIINHNDDIIGIITDGDLRRHMGVDINSEIAKNIMTVNPIKISRSMFAGEALSIMSKKNITSLLVTDNGKIEGILHIHDLLRAGVK